MVTESVPSKLSAAAKPRPKAWIAQFSGPVCNLKVFFAISARLFVANFCYSETFLELVIVWGSAHLKERWERGKRKWDVET